jgi:hypothetical protein
MVYGKTMLQEVPGAGIMNVVQMNNTLTDDRHSDQEVSAVVIKNMLDCQHAIQ